MNRNTIFGNFAIFLHSCYRPISFSVSGKPKGVVGRDRTYYQVLIDDRDTPFIVCIDYNKIKSML